MSAPLLVAVGHFVLAASFGAAIIWLCLVSLTQEEK